MNKPLNAIAPEFMAIAAEMLGITVKKLLRERYYELLGDLHAIDDLARKSGEEGGLVSRQAIAIIIHNWEKGSIA